MKTISLDTETERIEAGNLAPKMICASMAVRADQGEIEAALLGNHPDDGAEECIAGLLTDTDTKIVTHNGGFDYAVLMRSYPALIPLIFVAILAGRATDTLWREKHLNLSSTGNLETIVLPD